MQRYQTATPIRAGVTLVHVNHLMARASLTSYDSTPFDVLLLSATGQIACELKASPYFVPPWLDNDGYYLVLQGWLLSRRRDTSHVFLPSGDSH